MTVKMNSGDDSIVSDMTSQGSVEESLDHGQCTEMAKYVEQLTHSGSSKLDEKILKSLKRICRKGNEYVKHVYHLVMTELDKQHAEIRLSAFQIIDELFQRSHCFRELLLTDFNRFLELTAEISNDDPLPPPTHAARSLKQQVIAAVQKWQESYGKTYKRLTLGFNYLRNCKKLEFEAVRSRTAAQRQHEEAEQQRKQRINNQLLEKLENEIKECQQEIDDCLKQTENCLGLVTPDPEFHINWDTILKSSQPTSQSVLDSQTDACSEEQKRVQVKNWVNSFPSDVSSNLQHKENGDVGADNNKNPMVNSQSKLCLDNFIEPNDGYDFDEAISISNEFNMSDIKSSSVAAVLDSTSSVDKNCDDIVNEYAVKSQNPDNSVCISEKTFSPDGKKLCNVENEPCKQCDDENSKETTGSYESDSDHEDLESVPDLDTASVTSKSDSDMMRMHGVGSWRYSLDIKVVPEINETTDNKAVIDNMRDLGKLTARYLSIVTQWLEKLTRLGGRQNLVKDVIQSKQKLQTAQNQIEKITGKVVTESQKKARIKIAPPVLSSEIQNPEWKIVNKAKNVVEELQDPTAWAPNMKAIIDRTQDQIEVGNKNLPSCRASESMKQPAEIIPSQSSEALTNRKSELLKIAPVLPFDMDLYYWGQNVSQPAVVKFDSLHRFWAPPGNEEFISPQMMDAYTTRSIHLNSHLEPIKWKCRAQLSNGKLCERMDRLKCPFHGKIVPRDVNGHPTDSNQPPDDVSKKKDDTPEWQDPEFLNDIEAIKGVKLKPTKKKGKRGPKYPGLTDIKKVHNTTKRRLENKVFNTRVMKRVNSTLNKIDAKRHDDKFGNQFNYTFTQ